MDREPAQSFHDLVVWQKAHAFVLATYRFSANFPVHETYGLRAQLRRAAVSVPANISEDFKKRGKADKARVLNIAEASLEESRYYLLLAHDLGYGRDPALNGQAEEVAKLLTAYTRSIKASAS
jgi:four helix bundle protein